MKIKEKNVPHLIVELSGRLDLHTAESTEKAILAELDGITSLELDLSGLEYVSSAGLRTLLGIQKALLAKSGAMKVTHVNEDVRDIFEITGFSDILTIE